MGITVIMHKYARLWLNKNEVCSMMIIFLEIFIYRCSVSSFYYLSLLLIIVLLLQMIINTKHSSHSLSFQMSNCRLYIGRKNLSPYFNFEVCLIIDRLIMRVIASLKIR